MKIGGHSLRDHFGLLAPLFGLIAAVWALRLILDAAGAPSAIIRITSVTTAASIALLLAVLLIHFRRFGGYPSVVVAALLLTCWQELLVIAAIVFAVLTGSENVFSAARHGRMVHDPRHLRHIMGHLTFGLGLGTLLGSAMGCVLLWVLRRIDPTWK